MHGGIDEAGRGPVLGPLVVAGVACPDPDALLAMGCKDSKRLTAGKRERIARLLEADPSIRIEMEVLAPERIDALRATQSLNAIEVDMFQAVARRLKASHLVVDAVDVDAARFGRRIAAGLEAQVQSEHRADDRHPAVMAASIIAKTTRDAAIDEMRRLLERRIDVAMGSGYPSDPKTQAFLAAWLERFGDLPPGTRRSWRTARDLLSPQAPLDAFG